MPGRIQRFSRIRANQKKKRIRVTTYRLRYEGRSNSVYSMTTWRHLCSRRQRVSPATRPRGSERWQCRRWCGARRDKISTVVRCPKGYRSSDARLARGMRRTRGSWWLAGLVGKTRPRLTATSRADRTRCIVCSVEKELHKSIERFLFVQQEAKAEGC
ncbi:hypothetical protein BJV74DRAFT_352035 [Russula compacta]|nr:hypothetical protein BJV74DRAFT_352035 [Russula compacta]